ncbi:MAG: thioredoxin family protein, partial [Gemmatimonadaceae bacterium]|nr:thioredoxin family protein [Chitinophagaceae bacterium]
TWCPPCRKMEPVLAELKSTTENYILQKMDAGIELQLMKSLNVSELPTFIVYRDGVETWRKSGLATLSELQTALKK